MHHDDRAGLRAYRFDTLPVDRVDTLVSTRLGGLSQGSYASLNLGLRVEDDDATVVGNRERLFSLYELPLDRSVWCLQVHRDVVTVVRARDVEGGARGAYTEDDIIPGTDALITALPGIPLSVTIADCVPVVIYDPGAHAVGLVHAGWGGTVARISSRTVWAMQDEYGSDPATLICGIGPSISPSRYEVGADVIARAREAYGDAPILRESGDEGKALFDLWEANLLDLESAGVPRGQIEVSGISTIDALDEFYSHRFEARGGVQTGRFAAVAMLRP